MHEHVFYEALGSLDGVEGIAIHRLTESDAVRRARAERSPA